MLIYYLQISISIVVDGMLLSNLLNLTFLSCPTFILIYLAYSKYHPVPCVWISTQVRNTSHTESSSANFMVKHTVHYFSGEAKFVFTQERNAGH